MPRRRREGLPPEGLVLSEELRVPDRSDEWGKDKPEVMDAMLLLFKGLGNWACWRIEGSSNPRSAELPPPDRIVSDDLQKKSNV